MMAVCLCPEAVMPKPRNGFMTPLPMQVTQPSGVPTLERGGLIAPATHVRADLARFHIASATVPVVEAVNHL